MVSTPENMSPEMSKQAAAEQTAKADVGEQAKVAEALKAAESLHKSIGANRESEIAKAREYIAAKKSEQEIGSEVKADEPTTFLNIDEAAAHEKPLSPGIVNALKTEKVSPEAVKSESGKLGEAVRKNVAPKSEVSSPADKTVIKPGIAEKIYTPKEIADAEALRGPEVVGSVDQKAIDAKVAQQEYSETEIAAAEASENKEKVKSALELLKKSDASNVETKSEAVQPIDKAVVEKQFSDLFSSKGLSYEVYRQGLSLYVDVKSGDKQLSGSELTQKLSSAERWQLEKTLADARFLAREQTDAFPVRPTISERVMEQGKAMATRFVEKALEKRKSTPASRESAGGWLKRASEKLGSLTSAAQEKMNTVYHKTGETITGALARLVEQGKKAEVHFLIKPQLARLSTTLELLKSARDRHSEAYESATAEREKSEARVKRLEGFRTEFADMEELDLMQQALTALEVKKDQFAKQEAAAAAALKKAEADIEAKRQRKQELEAKYKTPVSPEAKAAA